MASSSSTTFKDLNFVTSDTDNEDEAPLPAPMTTRNRIPRSRATSLARSRGSSRASSVSGSRNGSRAASRAGSVRGSRPGSRAGLVDLVDSALGSGSRTTGGLVWQQGGDMSSMNDELGYVGASSSSAVGPSGYGQWKTEDEEIPLSNKAKGKKRARSTPEDGDDGGVRSKARMASPQGEEQPAPYNHEYTPFPSTTFSFITQTQPEEPPQTQLSSSVGSSTLASTATLGSFNSGVSFSQYDLPGDLLDFMETPGAQQDSSAFSDVSFQGSAVSSTRAQAGSFVFRAGTPYEPDFAGSSASGSSSGRTNDTSGGGAVVDGGSPSVQATSSTSSSSPAQAGASGPSLPWAPIIPSSSPLPIPRNPTPPPQPDLLSSYTCPICFFPPTNATLTPCGHICCGSCLFTAIKSSQSRSGLALMSSAYANQGEALCPVCRATIAGWDGKGGGVIGLRVRSVISI